jgi:hypothetical protein
MMPESMTAQEGFRLFLRAEAHHAFDARAVVPAPVEKHDFARRRQMRQITLHVHLRLLALGGRGQRDHAEDARAHALGDCLDRAALARAVAPFEYDADLRPRVDGPFLELHELDMQTRKLLLILLSAQALMHSRAFAHAPRFADSLLFFHRCLPMWFGATRAAAPRPPSRRCARHRVAAPS